MDSAEAASRWPAPKQSITGFAEVSGPPDQAIIGVTDPQTMAVVLGIDVTASSSGTTTEFFFIDVKNTTTQAFIGSIFGNQVSPPTGLWFSWRGEWPLYAGSAIFLHSVSGPWVASAFGFITSADNLPH